LPAIARLHPPTKVRWPDACRSLAGAARRTNRTARKPPATPLPTDGRLLAGHGRPLGADCRQRQAPAGRTLAGTGQALAALCLPAGAGESIFRRSGNRLAVENATK
jgi:hypothetical protein